MDGSAKIPYPIKTGNYTIGKYLHKTIDVDKFERMTRSLRSSPDLNLNIHDDSILTSCSSSKGFNFINLQQYLPLFFC
jgi:hypothetical protein